MVRPCSTKITRLLPSPIRSFLRELPLRPFPAGLMDDGFCRWPPRQSLPGTRGRPELVNGRANLRKIDTERDFPVFIGHKPPRNPLKLPLMSGPPPARGDFFRQKPPAPRPGGGKKHRGRGGTARWASREAPARRTTDCFHKTCHNAAAPRAAPGPKPDARAAAPSNGDTSPPIGMSPPRT